MAALSKAMKLEMGVISSESKINSLSVSSATGLIVSLTEIANLSGRQALCQEEM